MQPKKKFLMGLLAAVLVGGVCFWVIGMDWEKEKSKPQAQAEELASSTAGSFVDVPQEAWYAEAVGWCLENNIMSGITEIIFGSDDSMNRAMLATVLYRVSGSPEVSSTANFTDVEPEIWYSKSVAWAGANGIIAGYGNNLFGPQDPVTREQIATILWRYAGSAVVENEHKFADAETIAVFAQPAVAWAGSLGIMSGKENNLFDPQSQITRAEVAVILWHYLNLENTEAEPSSNVGTDNTSTPSAVETTDPSTLEDTSKNTSVVFMTKNITPESLLAVYEKLQSKPQGNIAVKLSTGEPGSNYLRVDLIGDLVKSLPNPTIVECNTAYGGSRASTAMHYQVAEDHGYTSIAKVDIMDENGSLALPVTGGTNLTENYVGANFENYDYFLVLSHFKGHAMAGFGGAIKNISIGIASAEGKSWIHSGGNSLTNPWGGEQDPFLESMAEAGKSVVEALEGQIIYVNVMNRLSVDCDCDSSPAEPDMHDIGILASTDPVALDQACIDLVYAAPDGKSLIERIESRNGLHTLEHAQQIGLGSRTYELVSIDD